MTMNREMFEALLAEIRAEFLDELPDRCDDFEELILELQKFPDNRDSFQTLYRGVHSLKGSGGTHSLPLITTICHQLENLLSETDAHQRFDGSFVDAALALVDLLRRIETAARQDPPDFSTIEQELEAQRIRTLQHRRPVLVVESSGVMAGLCRKALEDLPLQLTLVDDGLTALERLLNEPYEMVIAGRELKTLNAIPLLAALRTSQSRNQQIPALLLTSRSEAIPDFVDITAIISRDRQLSETLREAVTQLLP